VGADTVIITQDFHYAFCQSDIHLALDIFEGHRVVLAIDADVIIILDSGDL
jgi:hypothetical protein